MAEAGVNESSDGAGVTTPITVVLAAVFIPSALQDCHCPSGIARMAP